MNQTDKPGRRRALVTATAALTAIATIAGLGFLGLTTTPSRRVRRITPTAGAAVNATPLDLPPSATSAASADRHPTTAAHGSSRPRSAEHHAGRDGTLAGIRNVVFVLADDLDWNLFEQVPRLAALQDKGMTFTHHTVTDSLCCPSRTSILRGQYIHNHDVVSNLSTDGRRLAHLPRQGLAHRLPADLAAVGRRRDRAVRQVPQRVPGHPAARERALRASGLGQLGRAHVPR